MTVPFVELPVEDDKPLPPVFSDGMQALVALVLTWSFLAGLISLLGVLAVDGRMRLFLASATVASTACGVASAFLLSLPNRRIAAAATLAVAAAGSPSWMLWPVPVTGLVFAAVIFLSGLRAPKPAPGTEGELRTVAVDGDALQIAERTRQAIAAERRRRATAEEHENGK